MLALLGPTASGKSALAVGVAEARIAAGLPTEIVAVDAFTVYRGMDVGTAKPDAAVRARVPHHLLDVLDASQELSVVHRRAGSDGESASEEAPVRDRQHEVGSFARSSVRGTDADIRPGKAEKLSQRSHFIEQRALQEAGSSRGVDDGDIEAEPHQIEEMPRLEPVRSVLRGARRLEPADVDPAPDTLREHGYERDTVID